ncbi:hypothetical protein OAU05_00490 [bacterium]|nr:hypothetical protein [bacterium]
MADTVSTQIIQDGSKQAIIKVTAVVGNTDVVTSTMVDVSSLSVDPVSRRPCTGAVLAKLVYVGVGVGVKLEWDATANVLIFDLPVNWTEEYDFTAFTGIPNNAGAGKTGDIVATTVAPTAGDTYTFIFTVNKQYG